MRPREFDSPRKLLYDTVSYVATLYEAHPCLSDRCDVLIPEQKRFRKYCSRSCSASSINRLKVDRIIEEHGYLSMTGPTARAHPSHRKNGIAQIHVMVAFDHYGVDVQNCAYCGIPIQWLFGIRNSRKLGLSKIHVHHVNFDTRDNRIENLRLTCSGCNTSRAASGESISDRSKRAVATIQATRCTCSECGREFDSGFKFSGHKSYGHCPNGERIVIAPTR